MFKGFARAVSRRHATRKVVSAPPSHLFNIVTDVDQYRNFLAFCSESKILKSWDAGRRFEATVTIDLPPLIRETYVSDVTVDRDNLRVDIKSIKSSMFDSLKSHWQLRPVKGEPDKVDTELEVVVSTSDPFLSVSLGALVEKISSMQVDAFEKRCRQVPVAKESDGKPQPQ